MKQEINSEVEGGVAGRDIIHRENTVVHVNFGANHGGQQFIVNEPIHMHFAAAAPRPRINIVIQPGPECIDEKKAATLKSLVSEIVRLEALLKPSPRGYAAVWNALNAKCQVTSYHLIKAADAPKAERFLREWIGRLSAAPSAPVKDAGWRNRKFTYIFANIKQLNADAALRAQLLARYGSPSMKALTDSELDSVYRLVAGWKKVGHAPGQAQPEPDPVGM